MVQSIDFCQPTYNAVNISIKKPEINANGAKEAEGNCTNPVASNCNNSIFNAVKIDIDNPKVNTEPKKIYDYPEANEIVTYEMLNYSPIAIPEKEDVKKADIVEEESILNTEAEDINEDDLAEKKNNNSITALSFKGETSDIKKPEIIPSEKILPKIDISKASENLASKDRDVQAKQIEEVVRTALTDPELAKHYLVSDIFTGLIKITEEDVTKLQPPTQKQVEVRQKLIANIIAAERDKKSADNLPYKLSEEDINLAINLTPLELAERNKEYAITALSVLAELFIEDYEEKEGRIVPITDAPGVSAIVNALRKDPDSAVKLAALDALRHIQRPEYKEELSALYTMAQTDPNPTSVKASTILLQEIQKV